MFKLTWKNFLLLIESLIIALIIVWALSLITSCVVKKEVVKETKTETTTEKKDSSNTRQETTLSDTTVTKKLAADSVKKDAPLVVKDDSCWFEPMFAYGKYGYAKAWSFKGKAYMNYFEGGMDIEFKLDNAIRTSKYWYEKYTKETEKKNKVETVKETITITKNSLFARICIWFSSIVLGACILAAVFVRIRK